jgi:hypothetical protein
MQQPPRGYGFGSDAADFLSRVIERLPETPASDALMALDVLHENWLRISCSYKMMKSLSK